MATAHLAHTPATTLAHSSPAAVSQTSTALAPRSIQPIPISLLHDPTHLASVAAKLRSRIAYLELLKTSRAPEITEEHRASVLLDRKSVV